MLEIEVLFLITEAVLFDAPVTFPSATHQLREAEIKQRP
jgi:hypothetical protein